MKTLEQISVEYFEICKQIGYYNKTISNLYVKCGMDENGSYKILEDIRRMREGKKAVEREYSQHYDNMEEEILDYWNNGLYCSYEDIKHLLWLYYEKKDKIQKRGQLRRLLYLRGKTLSSKK